MTWLLPAAIAVPLAGAALTVLGTWRVVAGKR